MRRALGVGIVLLLVMLSLPSDASAQQSGQRAKPTLGQNYPNPFNPTTKFPITLPEAMFEGGKTVVVTARISNFLGQLVAIPAALGHPAGNVAIDKLEYTTPGVWVGYWDGTDRSGKKVASATYLLEVFVNGERMPIKKLVVAK